MKKKSAKKERWDIQILPPPPEDKWILTAKELKDVIEYVEKEAEDKPNITNETTELMVLILVRGVTPMELINLNLADLPCCHREPQITVRNIHGKIRHVYLYGSLERKLNEYIEKYRKGAGPSKPLFESRYGHRTTYRVIYGKITGLRTPGIAGKLGIENLTPGIFRRTAKYQLVGKREPEDRKKLKAQERRWMEDRTHDYMSANDAIKLAHNNNRKLSLSQLSKILKPDGPIRYMRKKKPYRCKVHVRDFLKFIKTLPYIKPEGAQISDEILDEYIADKEAQQAELRGQKKSHGE